MPLTFDSLSHGEVAFGFFNIETDMVLLEDHFFFAGDFCKVIIDIAAGPPGDKPASLDVYILEYKDMGNLMGAITGVDLRGFIGDVYGAFPFPAEPEAFKENPEGFRTREVVETIIRRYAGLSKIPVGIDAPAGIVYIGPYRFSTAQFHRLIEYVWVGGAPRWKDGVRPSYVTEMKEKIAHSRHPVFHGIKLL